ncbi:MAG: ribosome small subunit-dependent GTPase A [Candidatus Cloacimonetes bacterium]|nr:ribosome small subunit-dependent GTPase A [Candidatus Cloacimonadota bacterium]
MIKKREKKKFKRKNIKIQNIEIDNLEKFEEEDIIEEKRAEKKIVEKGEISKKANLELKKGRILEVKSNYKCLVGIGGSKTVCTLSGRLKQVNFKTRTLVAVGDYVNVDISEILRIEEILPRKNSLSRFSEDDFQTEIVLAANIDQVVITSSFKEPKISLGLIDRYICAAEINEIIPIICINKVDLADNLEIVKNKMNFYKMCNFITIYTSAKTGYGIEELREILKGKETVFSGHSGAGKSSLINLLQPGIDLKVAEISDYSKKGVHATSSARLLEWNFGGYLVDTPGIKTFGLHREDKDKIHRVFPGISELVKVCKFKNCTHTHEKDCEIKKAIEKGYFPVERYDSYVRIFESL